MLRWFAAFASSLVLLISCIAQTNTSKVLNKPEKIVLQELEIGGVRTLDNAELNELKGQLTGHEYRDNADELRERLRNAFQERGYFDAQVNNFDLKPLDPLARPKPVRLEAEVSEGPRYTFSEVKFVGNRAFSEAEMRAQVPIKPGDYFSTDKVRSGLLALRKLYESNGYQRFVLLPKTVKSSDAKVTLEVQVNDGPQFRMGTLEMNGNPDLALELRSNWTMAPGTVFDGEYPEKFVDDNRALLPADFNYRGGVHIGLNCNELTAAVLLDLDPKHPSSDVPKTVGCEKAKATPEEMGKQGS